MSDYQNEDRDLHHTLAQLLDFQTTRGPDQGNTLILLSLVNLMGILNVLNKKIDHQNGVQENTTSPVDLGGLQQVIAPVANMLTKGPGAQDTENSNQNSNQGSAQNPLGALMNLLGGGNGLTQLASLLSLLTGTGQNQKQNQNMDLTSLMKMFNSFIGAKPSADLSPAAESTKRDETVSEDSQVEKAENKNSSTIIVEKRKDGVKKQ